MALLRCAGCGALWEGASGVLFSCPQAEAGDGVDHLLAPIPEEGDDWPVFDELNPFLRYRRLLFSYRLAQHRGLSDQAYVDIVGELDDAISTVDGAGFKRTPLIRAPGLGDDVWVKNETEHVGGSHKARHLMSVLVALRVEEVASGVSEPGRRLAIASCGNAALAAAVLARAAGRPIDVYIPEDAPSSVVERLRTLGASLNVCPRAPGGQGDPCMEAFRAAVESGSVPFSVQGPENGLVVEGGCTLAWEVIEQLEAQGVAPGEVFVQVGGGALASGVCEGLLIAERRGLLRELPVVHTVQTQGAYPLKRAFERVRELSQQSSLQSALGYARTRRSGFMWPWETTPRSVAHGILDDETYDWAIPVEMMIATGGQALAVSEEHLREAHVRGRKNTGIDVCATGTAGLAGLLSIEPRASVQGARVLLFTGAER